MRNQIIIEAEEYIQAFYEKRKLNVETNKANNIERVKVKCQSSFLAKPFLFSTMVLVLLILEYHCVSGVVKLG